MRLCRLFHESFICRLNLNHDHCETLLSSLTGFKLEDNVKLIFYVMFKSTLRHSSELERLKQKFCTYVMTVTI